MIKVRIDGLLTEVEPGTTIMEAAKKLNIDIPSLCYHPELDPLGVCRLCMVELAGEREPVPACTYKIEEVMDITTNSPNLREIREVNISLLLSKHDSNCTTCPRGENCELRVLSERYISKELPYEVHIPERRLDNLSPSIYRDYSKCILCRRCIGTCLDIQGIGLYGIKNRGSKTLVGTFNDSSLQDNPCTTCGQCINRCPTGALYEVECRSDIWKEILNPEKHVVIQTAPAPRAAIGECFGYKPGKSYTYELNTALKRLGFDKVFDTCFTADLTIMEEGSELLQRVKDGGTLPLFTSCSPGWVKYIEYNYPDMIDNLSSAKSPHEMFGAILKTHYAKNMDIDPSSVVVVSLMPCTAKKAEIVRPELQDSGYQDVDYVLTTREMGKMIRETGLELKDLQETEFDTPFGDETGSGVIFASTGGVMESALRTLYHITTGENPDSVVKLLQEVTIRGFEGVKYAEIPIKETVDVPDILKGLFNDFQFLKGQTLKVAVCHGTANAHKVLENIRSGGLFKDCHFIEFMACPGGCIGGGGQPIPIDQEIRQKRMNAVYFRDDSDYIRISAYNPSVLKIYNDFFDNSPGGKRAKNLLHTFYYKTV